MHAQTTPGVLIIEGEPIIALDAEGILVDAGFEVAERLATRAGVLGWLDSHSADVAILDIHL